MEAHVLNVVPESTNQHRDRMPARTVWQGNSLRQGPLIAQSVERESFHLHWALNHNVSARHILVGIGSEIIRYLHRMPRRENSAIWQC